MPQAVPDPRPNPVEMSADEIQVEILTILRSIDDLINQLGQVSPMKLMSAMGSNGGMLAALGKSKK